MTRYKITAACVQVRVPLAALAGTVGRGSHVAVLMYPPAPMPQDAHPEDLARLLRKGMIEEAEYAD